MPKYFIDKLAKSTKFITGYSHGTVSGLRDANGYGNYTLFYIPKYKQKFHMSHISNIQTLEVQEIKKGTVIAHIDNTGVSTGEHLHIGVALGENYNTIKIRWSIQVCLTSRNMRQQD